MPILKQYLTTLSPARIFLYGAAKTKKTWFAGKAAESGYRVLFLDGDKGTKILKNLSPKAQERIYAIDLQNKVDRAVMAPFITDYTKHLQIYWDEKNKTVPHAKTENPIWIDSNSWGSETVIVLDSWTSLIRSIYLEFALKNDINLADAEKTEWEGYGWAGRLANILLERLCCLSCHLVIIGHATQYEKFKTMKMGSKTIRTLEWSRRQAVSTSGPQAMTLSVPFDEFLYFQKQGARVSIETDGDKDKDGGSRTLPPQVLSWDKFDISQLLGGEISPPSMFDFTKPTPKANKEMSKPKTDQTNKPKPKFNFS